MKTITCDICGKDTHLKTWSAVETPLFTGFGYASMLPEKERQKDICLDCGNALQKAINETIEQLKSNQTTL